MGSGGEKDKYKRKDKCPMGYVMQSCQSVVQVMKGVREQLKHINLQEEVVVVVGEIEAYKC